MVDKVVSMIFEVTKNISAVDNVCDLCGRIIPAKSNVYYLRPIKSKDAFILCKKCFKRNKVRYDGSENRG